MQDEAVSNIVRYRWVNGMHVPASFTVSCGYDQLTIGIATRRLQRQMQVEKPFEYSSGYKRTSDGGLFPLKVRR